MELLFCLRNPSLIKKVENKVDGVIVGSLFAMGYSYSLNDIKQICHYCLTHNLKAYIVMDSFINEDEIQNLYDYLKFLSTLNISGIYFHDLAVMNLAKEFNLTSKLIYDGYSVMCNSFDAAYYLSKGLNSIVISRELTMQEVVNIVSVNKGRIDMQIFGHLRMSYSKRKFIKNYFKQINTDYNYQNKQSLYLIEEKRNYKMPIVEDQYGTRIYSDFVFEMFNELPYLHDYLNRGIVDPLFINENYIEDILRELGRLTKDNSNFLKNSIRQKYPDNYSTGYLYQKTNLVKDEQD